MESHYKDKIDGLVQERRNSSALAMELRLSCTNPADGNETALSLLSYHCYNGNSYICKMALAHSLFVLSCMKIY